MCQEKKVLVVIDLQNDYFPGGLFPLWNAEAILDAVVAAIGRAKELAIPVVEEVSIGHALIGEALYAGLQPTVRAYLSIIKNAAR